MYFVLLADAYNMYTFIIALYVMCITAGLGPVVRSPFSLNGGYKSKLNNRFIHFMND